MMQFSKEMKQKEYRQEKDSLSAQKGTRKIGILGGTFLPMHMGHLMMAKAALKTLFLDQVWILPNGNPPYKKVRDQIPDVCRLELIRCLIQAEPKMVLKDIECRRSSFRYSYQTMTELDQANPDITFYFIMGEDSLDYFDHWRHPEIITEHAKIAVIGRPLTDGEQTDQSRIENPDFKALSLPEKCKAMAEKYRQDFFLVPMEPLGASSSEIRSRLKSLSNDERKRLSEDPGALEDYAASVYLSPKELYYILEHRLFESRQKMTMTITEIENDLKKRLKPSRYQHTMGVMYTAAALAMRYQYPMESALYAGLLHDCAKYESGENLLKICRENGIPVTEVEEKSPQLLHAKVGAFYARERYGVKDPQILHAITVHTTGMPNMSMLDKILFIADYIEPGRDKARNLTEIRSLAFEDLDRACAKILKDTLDYLNERGQEIDTTTEATYEFYSKV